tara:strand:+ start:205 stop:1155 length:951 start_codon:yes stop_codon:yes gene_type:complete
MYIFHDHLDGGLRPLSLLQMAKACNYEDIMHLSSDEVVNLLDKSESSSLEDFLSAFTHTIHMMQTYENIERIAYEAAEDMHINGIKFYEARFAPLYSVNEELTLTDVIGAIHSGFNEAEANYGIKSGVIVCGMRNDPESVKLLANEVIENIHKSVIGFDIAGPELGYPANLYKEEFIKLKNNGINLTIHAGEGAGVDYIEDALNCGADRIGHGVRIIEDIQVDEGNVRIGEVAQRVLDNQILLEVCISSNIHTKMYKDFQDHPISLLNKLGFNISINTDNRLMSNTSYKNEQRILYELNINPDINKDLASYSFLKT